VWYDLIGLSQDFMLLEHVHSSDIIPGQIYEFQIRAKNKWGWGEWSGVTWIVASTWPEDVAKPVTSIDPTTGGVLIDWAKPDDHSSEIFRYVIEIQSMLSADTWVQEMDYCDGT
jgi:hypothetical protein